jgi:TorA-specific chaperone
MCSTRNADLARIAEWIGAIFIAPLDAKAVDQMRTGPGRDLLAEIGGALGCCELTGRIATELLDARAEDLSARYVRLFDGVSGRRTVSLYESFYRADGTRLFQNPVDEMRQVLRHLDMSVRDGCKEPADHSSIEFAALAVALDTGDNATAMAMTDRLQAWVPKMRVRLDAEDPGVFYSAAAAVAYHLLTETDTAIHEVSP